MALRETLVQIRAQPRGSSRLAVHTRIVTPILEDLGWDAQDPEQVDLDNGAADVVLLGPRGRHASSRDGEAPRPVVYIKIEPIATALLGAAASVVAAGVRDDVDICVTTDGRSWTLYVPKQTQDPDQCQVAEWRLDDDEIGSLVSEFLRFLSRQALRDQTAQRSAEEALVERANVKRLTEAITAVWQRLLTGSDTFLAEYVQDEVRDETGLTPSIEQVAEVLRGSSSSRERLLVQGVAGDTDTRLALQHSVPRQRPTGYRLWGKDYPISRQREILTGVAEAIYARHANTFERVLTVSEYFTTDPSTRRVPISIGSSGYYHEGGMNRRVLIRTVTKLLEAFGYRGEDLHVLPSSPRNWNTTRSSSTKPSRGRRHRSPSRRPSGIRLFETYYPIQWQYEALTIVATQLYERHSDSFDRALHVSQITTDPATRTAAVQIGSTEYFHEKAVDLDRLTTVCHKLLDLFGYRAEDLELVYND